jgi:hypothetical protein
VTWGEERSGAGHAGPGTLIQRTIATTVQSESSPRLDADASRLLLEAARFWAAGEEGLVHALVLDDHDELVAAAEHVITMNARARRFISTAVHLDLEAVTS